MKLYAISLILFWIIIIVFPAILAYLVAWFLIYTWIVLLFIAYTLDKAQEWVKVGTFRIVKK